MAWVLAFILCKSCPQGVRSLCFLFENRYRKSQERSCMNLDALSGFSWCDMYYLPCAELHASGWSSPSQTTVFGICISVFHALY